MPRLPRLHVPGALYCATLRGNHERRIFSNALDRQRLEEFVADASLRTRTQVLAYCWMPSHIHLIAQVSDVPLGHFMRRIASRYARSVQRRLDTTGHFFESRYDAVVVDANEFLLPVLRDIHLQPVRATLTSTPEKYRWSSHRAYLGRNAHPWLQVDAGLQLLHPDRDRARQLYATYVSSRVDESLASVITPRKLADRRVLGGDQFISSLAQQVQTQPEAPAETLERIVRELCRDYGVTREQLRSVRQTRLLARVRGLITARALENRAASLAEISRQLNRSASALARAADRYGG